MILRRPYLWQMSHTWACGNPPSVVNITFAHTLHIFRRPGHLENLFLLLKYVTSKIGIFVKNSPCNVMYIQHFATWLAIGKMHKLIKPEKVIILELYLFKTTLWCLLESQSLSSPYCKKLLDVKIGSQRDFQYETWFNTHTQNAEEKYMYTLYFISKRKWKIYAWLI